MKKFMPFIAVVASFSLAPLSWGSLIWQDNFNYSDGNLTASGNWTAISGAGSVPIQVNGTVVTGMSAGSGSREDDARVLDATYSSGFLFAGFDFSLSYFFNFKDSSTGFRARVYIGAPASSGFRLGLENDAGDGAATVTFSSDLSLNTTYRAVVGYDVSAGTSMLWLGPSFSYGSPTLQDNTPAGVLSMVGVSLRQGGSGSGTASCTYSGLNLDNMIVATDFVTATAVPEPSTFALGLVGGFACFLAMRRKH
jgi:hypothetical protein